MSLEAGKKLGPYEIVGPLGAGGMGEVYKAKDTRLDRMVAIKVLPSHLSDDPERRQRFEREARAVSALNHPHICTLHDIGEVEGIVFLVMEHMEGENLGDRLEQGPLSNEELLRYSIQVADALAVAHRQGFVHRDLKPGNIMLTPGGAKLLDFGLAKAAEVGPASELTAAPTSASPLTAAGTIVGTFQYMAPEQLEGGQADSRSDIFSFGMVLYEMATGRKAFEGKTQAGLIASILKEEPHPITTLSPMMPPALDRVVKKCLAKDPEQRWQSASDLADQLRWIAEAGSQAGVPIAVAARRKSRERLWMGLALAMGAIALTLGSIYLFTPAPENRPTYASILPPGETTFSSIGGAAGPPVLSPDGKQIVFAAISTESIQELWVRPLNARTTRRLEGTQGAARPFWSPDARFVGFFANGKLKKIDLSSGSILTLADAPGGRGGTWNSDGVILFAPNYGGAIYRINANGGEVEQVTQLNRERNEGTHRYPRFLPDGNHFLFLARTTVAGTPRDTSVWTGSLDSAEPKMIVQAQSNAQFVSGYLLYSKERTLLARPFEPESLEFTGDPITVTNDLLVDHTFSLAVFSASVNGTLAFQTGEFQDESQLIWYDRQGKELEAVGDPGAFLTHRLSPDGRKVVASITDPGPGRSIWVYDLTRGIKTRLTFTSDGLDAYAQWSPDGKEVSYTSTDAGSLQIFRKVTSGAGAASQLSDMTGDAWPTDWTPDGKRILTTVLESDQSSTGTDIYMHSADGGEDPIPYLNARFSESDGKISPDGKWVAYVSDESGREEVYVAPFPQPTGKWQISTSGGNAPRWRGDGKEIYYLASSNKLVSVQVNTTETGLEIGEAQELFQAQVNPGAWEAYDVSADGQRFLINTGSHSKILSPITLVLNWTATLQQ